MAEWFAGNYVLEVERRWVADSLLAHELLGALIHGYRRLGAVVSAMDQAAGLTGAD